MERNNRKEIKKEEVYGLYDRSFFPSCSTAVQYYAKKVERKKMCYVKINSSGYLHNYIIRVVQLNAIY